MTHQDYENKKQQFEKLSEKAFLTEDEAKYFYSLLHEISQYEANNGLVDENEFNEPK